MIRRKFLRLMGSGTLALFMRRFAAAAQNGDDRPNILMITADDMNYDSLGVTGCRIPGITPNIDGLARDGMRFDHAHVTVSVCGPSRMTWATGMYPLHTKAIVFESENPEVPRFYDQLRKAGYLTGIFGKRLHYDPPKNRSKWDVIWDVKNPRVDFRNPEKFYENTRDFLHKAEETNKPFLLIANLYDPHPPFPGSRMEKNLEKKGMSIPAADKYYRPDEVEVPGFLPDLPAVRKEVAQYYAAVHRCDEGVGKIMRALKESGFQSNTMVMFLSDNGMAFPFAKRCCYLNSTRTPWIINWPDKVSPGRIDEDNMVSSIDLAPTILEAAGLPAGDQQDGRSILPLLHGDNQEGRDKVFTFMHQPVSEKIPANRPGYKNWFIPMRAVQDKRFGYIFNVWSDGKKKFGRFSSQTYRAREEAAKTDKQLAARVKFYQYRVQEEFNGYGKEPNPQNNLIDDPADKKAMDKKRRDLLEMMTRLNDLFLEDFKRRIGA